MSTYVPKTSKQSERESVFWSRLYKKFAFYYPTCWSELVSAAHYLYHWLGIGKHWSRDLLPDRRARWRLCCHCKRPLWQFLSLLKQRILIDHYESKEDIPNHLWLVGEWKIADFWILGSFLHIILMRRN